MGCPPCGPPVWCGGDGCARHPSPALLFPLAQRSVRHNAGQDVQPARLRQSLLALQTTPRLNRRLHAELGVVGYLAGGWAYTPDGGMTLSLWSQPLLSVVIHTASPVRSDNRGHTTLLIWRRRYTSDTLKGMHRENAPSCLLVSCEVTNNSA